MSAEQARRGVTIKLRRVDLTQQVNEGAPNINEQALLESQVYNSPEKINWKTLAKYQKHKHDGELHELRKTHSHKLFRLIQLWLIAGFVLVLFSGYGRWPFPIPLSWGIEPLKFSLDSKVLIALLVTTTATVLGLYAIAAKWLFNGNSIAVKDMKTAKTTGASKKTAK